MGGYLKRDNWDWGKLKEKRKEKEREQKFTYIF
jgi:hypothetical protein